MRRNKGMSTMIFVLAILVLSGIPACGKVEKTTEKESVLKNTSSPEKPGMYVLKNYTSWEELEEQGILWIEDGKLQTDIDYVNDGNYLTGDLKGTFVFPKVRITTIGERVFNGCAHLREIKIPDGVTTIEEYAFAGCTGVKEIQIPDSVTYIGTNAFENVEKITYKGTAFYNPDNQYWGAKAMNDSGYVQAPELTTTVDGVKYTYRKYNGNENQVVITKIENAGENYVIPSVLDGLEVCKIGNGEAVMTDTDLKKLTIPSGNIYIGDRAFYQCRTLQEIEWEKDTFNGRIGKEAFYFCDIREINLPYMKEMEKQIERHAFAANRNLEAVHFDKRNENINIGIGWFSECGRSEIFVPENAEEFCSERQWKTGKVHLLGTETKLKLKKIEKAKEGPYRGRYVEADETKSEDFRYFTYYKKFVVPKNAKALSDLENTYYGRNFNSLKKVKVIEISSFSIPDISKIGQSYAYAVRRDGKNNKLITCDLLAHLDDFYSFQTSVHKLDSYYIKMGKECGSNQIKYIEVSPKSLLGNRKELKRYQIGKVKWNSTSSQCDDFLGKPFQYNEGERCYRYKDYEVFLSFKKDKVNFMGVYHKNKEEALKTYQENNFIMQGCRVVKYTGNYNGKKVDLPEDIVAIGKSAFRLKKSKEPSSFNEYNKNQDGTKVQKISISVPKYVHIEPKAFYKSGPIEVTLEEGRTEVEPYAFWNASQIWHYGTIVRLPKSITRIREWGFGQEVGTSGDVTLYMGDNIKRMDAYALYGVIFDKLPKRLESMGDYCIYIRCQKEKLVIPKHVKKLGYNPITLGFVNQDEKLGVTVDKKNQWFKNDENGHLYSKDGNTLYFTYVTEERHIPKTVKKMQCELYA